ncbi:hypothetical protein [Candidatus Avelusimicrobium sp.]
MKINTKHMLLAAFMAFLLPCVSAQVIVVKQDGNNIYLDTSEHNRQVAVGDTFKVILSQEKLTNPKTGKELGNINHYSAEGKITEVQELYAIGQLPEKENISVGQEVVISTHALATQPQTAPVTQTALQTPKVTSNRKIYSYPVIDREIISAVKANITPAPGDEIAAIDSKGHLLLYTQDGSSLSQIADYQLPAGHKAITLSAKDIMDARFAQLFVVVYNEPKQKISTLIFKADGHKLKKIDSVPYFVKEIGCGDDKDLYAQKPFINGAKPGDARELDHEWLRFTLDDDRLPTRGNWLTGVNYHEIQNDDDDNFVYTASNGSIKIRLTNGNYAESPALFATAPNRVKYKQDIISFYPSLQVYGPDGRATLAAVENVAKMGVLSEQFGQYGSSKIHFLTYENGILDVRETIDLNGVVYDTNCTARGILVPQVLSGGQSVLTEIYR